MNYDETIRHLYNLQKHGIKFGLQNINRLLSAFHNPHKSFLAVHIGGTNGKGSTSAIIASVLQTAGFTVGLFTSPHLISFTERIRVNGEEITGNDVISIAAEIRDIVSALDEFSPTFFEVVTAIAMLYFKRKEIDIAVMEVGMGGRLDATNIIMPEVSVITNIGYDHKEFLGDTLREIAREKAGIIKEDVPAVISYQDREALDVIKMTADEKHADLYLYGRDFSSLLKSENVSGLCFDYRDSDSFAIHDLILPLTGAHQMQNASLAIKAARIVLNNLRVSGFPGHGKDTIKCIKDGIAAVKWPGRLEFIKENPPILIDAAHNPAAADALARALKRTFLETYKKIIIILGIMADKDIKGIMEPLLPLASEVILTAPSYSRAASPEHLADIAQSLGFSDLRIAPTVKDAIDVAIRKSYHSSLITHHSSLVLITGSFYTIGEAKEALGQKGVLTRLRE
ncbi:MAG: bifunctional folylpolyglutamate synthase/dihydrofolate synthase [Nitrospira sp.]|nr:bifunctional folylpolyglutamate synthase/dihydrofolate synthase [Nitrospira sp.]